MKAFFADNQTEVQLIERAEQLQEENATLAAETEKLRANARQLEEAQARIAALEKELATAQAATQAAEARAQELAQQDAAPAPSEPAAGVELATAETEKFDATPWAKYAQGYLTATI